MRRACKLDIIRFNGDNDPRLSEHTYCFGVDRKETCKNCPEMIVYGGE
jgi:hypothetical protein